MQAEGRRLWQAQSQDLLLAMGAICFAVVTYCAHGRLTEAGLGFLGICLLALLMGFWQPRQGGLGFLRLFYPQLFIAFFFSQCILLSTRLGLPGGGTAHDAFFANLDRLLFFGAEPSRHFYKFLGAAPWLNELMYAAYLLYFALFAATPWLAWFIRKKEEARRQLFIVYLATISLDIFYVFFRVMGPKYFFPELHTLWYDSLAGGPFVEIAKSLFSSVTLSGAAFPSTHAVMTTCTWLSARRFFPRLHWLWLLGGFLILSSTIYIYAHYLVDIICGILIGVPLYWAFGIMYDGQQRKPSLAR